MQLVINDNSCWVCGGHQNLTTHHTLPKHLKPQRNILVPICKRCHDKINSNDVNGLYAYAYKIEQLGKQMSSGANKLLRLFEENVKSRRKKDDS